MSPRRYQLKLKEGEETPVSVLGIERREEMLWISSEPVLEEKLPPCIRNILQARIEKGRHRTAAILAAFLGQAGWSEAEAKQLWSDVTDVEERIFSEWFQKMNCPKCTTLKRSSEGYPDMGIANLDLCWPDELCEEFQGPVEYAARVRSEEDRLKGRMKRIKTLNLARVFDWSTGREGEIELSESEKDELEALLKEQAEQKDKVLIYSRVRVKGRLRSKFILREVEGPRRQMLSEIM
jgi:hypothetical protein